MSRFFTQSAGTNDVMAMITAIGNADEFRQKLTRLQEAEESLDEKIALTGKAEDIARLHREASEARELATKTLEDSRKSAATIVENAQLEATKLMNSTALSAAQVREDAKAFKEDAKLEADKAIALAREEQKQVATQEAALQAARADLEERKRSLAADRDAVLAKERELKEREAQVLSEWEDIKVAKKRLDEKRTNVRDKAVELVDFAVSQKRGYEEFIAKLNSQG